MFEEGDAGLEGGEARGGVFIFAVEDVLEALGEIGGELVEFLGPWSAIFSAMIRASAAETLPWRTESSRVASIFSLVMTTAPTPARRVFLIRSIMTYGA